MSYKRDADSSFALIVGDRVSIGKHIGTVQWIGQVDYAKGEFVGLELDEPVGKNDGAVKGKRYFTCKPAHGMFRRVEDVNVIEANKPLESLDERVQENALEFKEQGNVCFKNKDYTKAITLYSKAISLDARNAVYYLNRSACYLNLKQSKKALSDANTAIALDNTWWKAYRRKGKVLQLLKRYEEAVTAFTQAAEHLRSSKNSQVITQEKEYEDLISLKHQCEELEQKQQRTQVPTPVAQGPESASMYHSADFLPPDFQAMLKDPDFVKEMEHDPEFQQLMQAHPELMQEILPNKHGKSSNTKNIHTQNSNGSFSNEQMYEGKNAPDSCGETAGLIKSRLQRPVLQVLPLQEAVKSGDMTQLETLLGELGSSESNKDVQDDHGLTALGWACKKGELRMVQRLVRAGAAVDPKRLVLAPGNKNDKEQDKKEEDDEEEDEVIPLHEAVHKGHLDIVKFLLAQGAHICARETILGHTCLHRAIAGNQTEVLQFLVDYLHSSPKQRTSEGGVTDVNGSSSLLRARDLRGLSPLAMTVAKKDWTLLEIMVHALDKLGDNSTAALEPSSSMSCLSQLCKLATRVMVDETPQSSNSTPSAMTPTVVAVPSQSTSLQFIRKACDFLLAHGALPGVHEVLAAIQLYSDHPTSKNHTTTSSTKTPSAVLGQELYAKFMTTLSGGCFNPLELRGVNQESLFHVCCSQSPCKAMEFTVQELIRLEQEHFVLKKSRNLASTSLNDSGQTCLMLAACNTKSNSTLIRMVRHILAHVEHVEQELGMEVVGTRFIDIQDKDRGNTALHYAGLAYNQALYECLRDVGGASETLVNLKQETPQLKQSPGEKCCIM